MSGDESDPLGIMQGIEMWPHHQMVFEQHRIHSRELDTSNPLGFWAADESPENQTWG